MKYTTIVVLSALMLLLFNVQQGYTQQFQLEISTTAQQIEVPRSSYSSDTDFYPGFSLGYGFNGRHRFLLSFSAVTANSSQSRSPRSESGIDLDVRSYPIGIEYRYHLLESASLNPFLRGAVLVIPTRDGIETDTPREYHRTTNWGAKLGLGLDLPIWNCLEIISSVNYRWVKENSERPSLHISLDGFHVQAGLAVRF